MPDYKRIAEELRRYIDDPSLGKDQVAQMAMEREVGCAVINTLPAILSALELAAAVERLRAWIREDWGRTVDISYTVDGGGDPFWVLVAHTAFGRLHGERDSLPAAINAALDAAEKKT